MGYRLRDSRMYRSILFCTTQDTIFFIFIVDSLTGIAALRTEIEVAMEVENEHLAEIPHLRVLGVRCSEQGQKAFAPSGRVAVMSEYRQVLLLHFHVNLDFGIQHRERGKRINYQNKETGQKDRAKHIDQP